MQNDPSTLYTLPLPTLWAMFFGLLNPWIIGLIVRSHWSSKIKSTVAFCVVLLSSMIGELIEGRLLPDTSTTPMHELTWRNWLSSLLYIIVLTYSMYTALYKPWKKAEEKDALEEKVNEAITSRLEVMSTAVTPTIMGEVRPSGPTLLIPLGNSATSDLANSTSDTEVNNTEVTTVEDSSA